MWDAKHLEHTCCRRARCMVPPPSPNPRLSLAFSAIFTDPEAETQMWAEKKRQKMVREIKVKVSIKH